MEKKKRRKDRKLTVIVLIGVVLIGVFSERLVFLLRRNEPSQPENPVIEREDARRINAEKMIGKSQEKLIMEGENITIE